MEPGRIVVLNGAPRAGKTSIARALQEADDGPWLNLGVDALGTTLPARWWPGLGLRPGGERPDIEDLVPVLAEALYRSVAVHARLGLDVVVDVGHHDGHSRPLDVLGRVAGWLDGLPALLVGVRCPVEEIMRRRNAGPAEGDGRAGRYATSLPDGSVPEAVLRWQEEVHRPGRYDLEVDTSRLSPARCARAVLDRLRDGPPPTALAELAARAAPTLDGLA